MANEKNRIEVLDFLRGVAALAVVFHHFFRVLEPGALRSASFYGQLGVQVFFVISGFIIPYSLYRGGYTLRNYGTFVLKRVIRLDPPYVVTVVLIILLGVLSWYVPFQKDQVFQVTLPQVLLHFAYVNVFFGYPWLSDVFWTLAIEFQYYLLIGLAFPLVFSRDARVRLLSFAALGSLAFVIRPPAFIFYFIFLFFMGILTCQYKVGMRHDEPAADRRRLRRRLRDPVPADALQGLPLPRRHLLLALPGSQPRRAARAQRLYEIERHAVAARAARRDRAGDRRLHRGGIRALPPRRATGAGVVCAAALSSSARAFGDAPRGVGTTQPGVLNAAHDK
ncbi:MAG: acyltransferase [Acidobacteria bacterium]|nr:acyltransferase [Acidobacteriota bacterium]